MTATFRERLRSALERDGRPLSKIAAVSGYSPSYIGRLLAGRQSNPSLLFVTSIAGALGVDPLDLLQ